MGHTVEVPLPSPVHPSLWEDHVGYSWLQVGEEEMPNIFKKKKAFIILQNNEYHQDREVLQGHCISHGLRVLACGEFLPQGGNMAATVPAIISYRCKTLQPYCFFC